MRPLRAGLVLALVLVGAVAGYLLAENDGEERRSFSGPEPVSAVSPSYPVDPVVVLPDPDKPALRAGLPLRRGRVGTAPFDLSLPVPRGWERSVPAAGEWRWYPAPGPELNTYFLRVRLIGNQYQPVEQALTARLNALRTADDVEDLRVLSATPDGFVAEYVSAGYRRVTMEKYVAQDGSAAAYAWVALVGRRQDRTGMTDLFERISDGIRP